MLKNKDNQEVKEHKINITPEMIEAGMEIFYEWCADNSWSWGDSIIRDDLARQLIEQLYSALSSTSSSKIGSKP